MAELEDIELKEISLVGKAANKKKFLFFKSEGIFSDIFKDDDSNLPDDLVEAKQKIGDAIVTLKKYEDDLPKDLAEAFITLLSGASKFGIPSEIENLYFNVVKMSADNKEEKTEDDFPSIDLEKPGRSEGQTFDQYWGDDDEED